MSGGHRILGIDPGVHGAAAVIDVSDGVAPKLIDCIDLPTVGVKAKERIDVHVFYAWIDAQRPDYAAIERGGSMPKQGIASSFKFGRACGAIETTVALCNVPYTLTEPAVWKRRLGLIGSDKEASRQLALQMFPSAAALLARKMDHQRAEAALIALVALQGEAK